jgi:hypothetical protein
MKCATLLAGAAIALGVVQFSLASVVQYSASLSGPNESPANASPGTGDALVTVDLSASTMRVEVSFTGLLGTTTASHIHAPTLVPLTGTAGVATTTPTFTGFPLGVTSGTYDHTFDLTLTSSYNSSYVAGNGGTASGAMSALLASLGAGKSYLNIHTSAFGGGEIRGFLTEVPEPSTCTLLLLGTAGVFGRRTRRQQIDA